MLLCPKCHSHHIVKNGSIHNGKQKYKCKECNRQFVENPKNKPVSDEQKEYIKKLLLERISLAGIARVIGLSKRWVQEFANQFYESIKLCIEEKFLLRIKSNKRRFILQCDEMWSFVANKDNPLWVWFAYDRFNKQVVGVYVGARDREGAQGLFDSLPEYYKTSSIFYTDFWKAYNKVLPEKKHFAVGKETGKTNHVERFNNTIRQRLSRFVRSSLSFSKKETNHKASLIYFINYYNQCIFQQSF